MKEAEDEKITKAEEVLVKFLQDSRVVHQIQSKCNLVIETLTKVQNGWRVYARRKEGFCLLLTKLWDKNYERVFQLILKGEYTPNVVAKVFDFKSYLKKYSPSDMKNNE